MSQYKPEIITQLANEIIHHRNLYYRGQPEISDIEYDALEEKLRLLVPEHPIFHKIGEEIETSTGKKEHQVPMLSLAKTYNIDDLLAWQKGRELVGTYKVDGNSLALVYRHGKLVSAKTRGNGLLGEDVSTKIRWVSDCIATLSLPESLNKIEILEVRGELYCSHTNFAKVVDEMQSLGLEKPSNPRNIVAGVLGRKQHYSLARFFSFFAFDILAYTEEPLFLTEIEKFDFLAKNSFHLPGAELLKSEEDIRKYLSRVREKINDPEFAMDGAVFAYNNTSLHKSLGNTSHHPRYKMSFKWQGEVAQSKIKDINWSTSRLGIVTPVAIIDPVKLSGAVITNVTLHNTSYVKNYNLKSGDIIEIVRSGEVIPKFLRVIKEAPGSYVLPSHCPTCRSPLLSDEIRLLCQKKECGAKVQGQILNWIKCVGIDDLSEKRLALLIDSKLVHCIEDLYKLSEEDLLSLPLIKEKMAKKLFTLFKEVRKFLLKIFLMVLVLQVWEKLTGKFC